MFSLTEKLRCTTAWHWPVMLSTSFSLTEKLCCTAADHCDLLDITARASIFALQHCEVQDGPVSIWTILLGETKRYTVSSGVTSFAFPVSKRSRFCRSSPSGETRPIVRVQANTSVVSSIT